MVAAIHQLKPRIMAINSFHTTELSRAQSLCILGGAAIMLSLSMGMRQSLGVIPLVNGLVTEIFGIRFLSTLAGIAFFSHQVGSFLGAWAGGVIYDSLGAYDRAWQAAVLIGLVAGTAQLLMNDRPTARLAAQAT